MRCAGARYPVAAVAIAVLVGCHTITEEEAAPTAPSEVSNFSAISIPVIGLASAAPTPTPAPAPASTPAPTSTPEPPPPPASGSCHLPPSNPASPVCTDGSPQLYAEVDAALDAVTERYPELVDFNDTRCGNCYYVKDPRRYIDEVIKQLDRQRLCTDGVYEELGIKSSNEFSEQYDIILSSNHMRRDGSYRGVCWPAIF